MQERRALLILWVPDILPAAFYYMIICLFKQFFKTITFVTLLQTAAHTVRRAAAFAWLSGASC